MKIEDAIDLAEFSNALSKGDMEDALERGAQLVHRSEELEDVLKKMGSHPIAAIETDLGEYSFLTTDDLMQLRSTFGEPERVWYCSTSPCDNTRARGKKCWRGHFRR